MTQLLSLLSHVFGNQAKGNDLEQFINRRNPKTHEELEALNRYYLYHYTRL
jgi:hypothetical protein